MSDETNLVHKIPNQYNNLHVRYTCRDMETNDLCTGYLCYMPKPDTPEVFEMVVQQVYYNRTTYKVEKVTYHRPRRYSLQCMIEQDIYEDAF